MFKSLKRFNVYRRITIMHNVLLLYTHCGIISEVSCVCVCVRGARRRQRERVFAFDFSGPHKTILKTHKYTHAAMVDSTGNVAYIKHGIDIAQTDATFGLFP